MLKIIFYNRQIFWMQAYSIERSESLTVIIPQHHKNTLIWIHGLNQHHEMHMSFLIKALQIHISKTKIIIPRAPNRFVSCMNAQASSWFDVKPRSEKSFILPFDEAFSSAEVTHSFQTILKPIIEEQSVKVKAAGGKLIVCGFSQGGGMSLHCLYSLPNLVDAAVDISGYLFPITPFDGSISNYVHVIYGLADDLRPWQYTKTTYEGKIPPQKITMVEGMKHVFDNHTEKELTVQLQKILE